MNIKWYISFSVNLINSEHYKFPTTSKTTVVLYVDYHYHCADIALLI